MLRGQSIATDALVLRAVDYRESDRIVTLLTERLGKVSAIARAAKRSRRRFSGALEPFSVIGAEISFGRSELGSLDQARVRQAFPGILRDLKKMVAAGAALELVSTASPERQPEQELFAATVEMFRLFDAATGALEEALVCFRMRAISVLGFAPDFDACGKCGKPAARSRAGLFDPVAGHLVCRLCGEAPIYLSGSTRARLLRAAGPGWTEEAAASWPEKELQQARRAISAFLKAHALAG